MNGGKTAKMVHSRKVKGYRRSGRKEAAPSTHVRAHRTLEAGNNTHGGRPGWLCPMDTRTCSLRLLQTRLDPQTYRVYDKDLRTNPNERASLQHLQNTMPHTGNTRPQTRNTSKNMSRFEPFCCVVLGATGKPPLPLTQEKTESTPARLSKHYGTRETEGGVVTPPSKRVTKSRLRVVPQAVEQHAPPVVPDREESAPGRKV